MKEPAEMLPPELLKLEATLRARVALWGGTMYRTEADNGVPYWIVTRWAMTRSFATLAEVEHFVDRVTGRFEEATA